MKLIRLSLLAVCSSVFVKGFSNETSVAPVATNTGAESSIFSAPKTVLNIAGEEIKWEDYISALEEQPGIDQLLSGQGEKRVAGFSVLQNLAYDTALMQISKAKGIHVTEEDIKKKLEELRSQHPHLDAVLKSSSISEARLKRELMVQLYQYRFVTHGVTVSDSEINDFYATSKDYTVPKQYDLRLILLQDAAQKAKVDAKLKTGKFEDAAKEFSTDKSKDQGGSLGARSKDQLPAVMHEALDKLEKGADKVSDWLTVGNMTFKVKLEKVIPENKMPLDDKLKKDIRERITIDKGSKQNNLAQSVLNHLTEKKVECTYGRYSSQFDGFLKSIKDRQEAEKKAKEKKTEEKKTEAAKATEVKPTAEKAKPKS